MDKTLNFSRKTNKTIYKGDLSSRSQFDDSCFGETSTLCNMARDLQSSYESENSSSMDQTKKSFESNSINFSKKFQQYRKPKENLGQRNISINEFEFLEEMGQGKYGKVYMARHK